MFLNTGIKSEFLELFYHDIVDYDLGSKNKLNFFILRISNNRLTYEKLVDELFDSIISYSLSRKQLDMYKDSQGGKKFIAARNKLRDYNSNDGELGEILLYCLLESHLKAPKIVTKLEIKTAKNDYIKGADGVHLLKLDETNFQLLFGESKLDGDLKTGIYNAFTSIMNFLNNRNNKIGFETNLVDSQLVKEAVDDNMYQYLRKILVPNANEDIFNLDNSFGIFLGFNFEIEECKKCLDNAEFRNYFRETTKNIVQDCISSINNQIEKKGLWGYNFYVYIVPFTDLATKRKEIIQTLTT